MTPAEQKLLALLLAADEADTQALIEEQQAARLAPSTAQRPLHAHELQAQTRFADLEEDRDAAVAEAEEHLEQLHDQTRAQVMGELFGEDRDELTPDEAQEVIHHLATHQPDEIAEAETSAAWALAGILAGAYLLGGRRVLEEAGRQGAPVADIAPAELEAEEFLPQARAVAQHPWRRVVGKLDEVAADQQTLTLDSVTREDIGGVLDDIKIDGSRDQARQAVNQSSGTGRTDTVVESELDPDEIWASEIMDGNACDQCVDVDGHQYTTMDEARRDYPRGQYRNCRGGSRCRGTLVLLFWDS